jgi:hypothetical protein
MDSLSDLCSEYPEGATEMEDDEQEYWKVLLEIKQAINPEKSADGTINYYIQFMKDWTEKFVRPCLRGHINKLFIGI